jgi:hypothetical protein
VRGQAHAGLKTQDPTPDIPQQVRFADACKAAGMLGFTLGVGKGSHWSFLCSGIGLTVGSDRDSLAKLET